MCCVRGCVRTPPDAASVWTDGVLAEFWGGRRASPVFLIACRAWVLVMLLCERRARNPCNTHAKQIWCRSACACASNPQRNTQAKASHPCPGGHPSLFISLVKPRRSGQIWVDRSPFWRYVVVTVVSMADWMSCTLAQTCRYCTSIAQHGWSRKHDKRKPRMERTSTPAI